MSASAAINEFEGFLNDFLVESDEHLSVTEHGLLAMEESIGAELDLERINEVFRAIHSVKGLSGMLELVDINLTSHKMETLLDRLRKGKMELTEEIVDLLLEGKDILEGLIGEVSSGEEGGVDFSDYISRIDAFLGEGPEPSPKDDGEEPRITEDLMGGLNEYETMRVEEALRNGLNVFRTPVGLNECCFSKGISVKDFFRGLSELGEVLSVFPKIDHIPLLDDFEPESFELVIMVLIITERPAEEIDSYLKNPPTDGLGPPDGVSPPSKKDEVPFEPGVSRGRRGTDSLEKPAVVEVTGKKVERKTRADDNINIDIGRLDNLMNLVGELIMRRAQLNQLSTDLSGLEEDGIPSEEVEDVVVHLSRVSKDLQEGVMRSRMLQMATIFDSFPRVVKDLAKERDKEIQLIMTGRETDMDKSIVEKISDPLVHLVRNALDHGVESSSERREKGKSPIGTIKLNGYPEGNHIIIEVEDDGKGMSPEKIRESAVKKGLIRADEEMSDNEFLNLIFAPGFSTAEKVSDISGRGVGMDVVRRNVTDLGGSIDIETQIGIGTKIIMKLPLTLATIQALFVEIGGETFAIPLTSVVESLRVFWEDIKELGQREVINLRDSVLPLMRVEHLFKLSSQAQGDKFFVVVIGLAKQKVGLVVETLLGEQEVVIKSLGGYLKTVPSVAGATITGDGRVIPILNVAQIIKNQNPKLKTQNSKIKN